MRKREQRLTSSLFALLIAGFVGGGCATVHQIDPGAAGAVIRERVVVDTRSLYAFPEREPLETPVPAAAEPVTEGGAFTIGAGDLVHLEIFDDPDLNREVAVRYDGYLSLPLIDEIHVAGLTRGEAESMVRDAYRAVFRQPRVSLTVVEPESKTFFVLGDISQPSEYPYRRPISLLEAINTAGGLRVETQATDATIGAQGQLTRAYIIREVSGQRQVYEHDLTGLRNPGAHPSQSPVLPGDIVYVPEGMNLVYVIGEVSAPQVYPLVEGMTLLELLARAGGPIEPTARMRSIVLFRKLDDGQTEAMLIDMRRALQTGFSPPMSPGDIVYVPRSPLVRLHDNMMRFTRLTETVAPLLDLYVQAYDAYYVDKRYRRLFDNNFGASPLGVIETLRTLPTWSGR